MMKHLQSLVYNRDIDISNGLRLKVPTVGEIIDVGEDTYYHSAFILTATPYDLMVQLHDAGIDFSNVSDYDVFLSTFPAQQKDDVSIFLDDIIPGDFVVRGNVDKKENELYNPHSGVVIDRVTYTIMSDNIRSMNFFEKHQNKPGNKEAYDYMIQKARKQQKRAARREKHLELERQIIAMVNSPEFKYDFQSVRGITIYAFNASVRQILHRLDYSNVMRGVYAGTVDFSKINKSSIDWLNCEIK